MKTKVSLLEQKEIDAQVKILKDQIGSGKHSLRGNVGNGTMIVDLLIQFARQWVWSGLALVMIVATAYLNVATSISLKPIYDAVAAQNVDRFMSAVKILLGLYVAKEIISPIMTLAHQRAGRLVSETLKTRLFESVFDKPVSFFKSDLMGELLERYNVINAMAGDLSEVGTGIVINVLVYMYAVAVMWKDINPLIALGTLVTGPVLLSATFLMGRWQATSQVKLQKINAETIAFIYENMSLNAVMKARINQMGTAIKKLYLQKARKQTNEGYKGKVISRSGIGFNNLVLNLCLVCFIYFTGIQVIQHGLILTLGDARLAFASTKSLTTGTLTEMVFLVLTAQRSLLQVFENLQSFQSLLALLRSSYKAILDKESLEDGTGILTQQDISDSHAPIVYENATLIYPESGHIGVREINLTVMNNEMIGLVGQTGSGKSTAMSLVPRFSDVNSGKVFVGGKNVKEVTQASLHSRMSMVTQKNQLKEGSFARNIMEGAPHASLEQVEAAAKLACIHDVIVGKGGYYAKVPIRTLSGGEADRIGLAAGLLPVITGRANILLLDEPFAALDNNTRRQVMDSLKNVQKQTGCTIMMVTHSIEDADRCDRVAVFSDGSLVELGTPEELESSDGLYRKFKKGEEKMTA